MEEGGGAFVPVVTEPAPQWAASSPGVSAKICHFGADRDPAFELTVYILRPIDMISKDCNCRAETHELGYTRTYS